MPAPFYVVDRVINADTLVISAPGLPTPLPPRVCRLSNVDAWENFGPDKLAGQQARQFTIDWTGAATDYAAPIPGPPDQWGRQLITLQRTDDGQDLGVELVTAGYAFYFVDFPTGPPPRRDGNRHTAYPTP